MEATKILLAIASIKTPYSPANDVIIISSTFYSMSNEENY